MIIRHFTFTTLESEPELTETIETDDITVLAGHIGRGLTFMDACPDGDMIDVYSFPSALHALAFATTVMAIRSEDEQLRETVANYQADVQRDVWMQEAQRGLEFTGE